MSKRETPVKCPHGCGRFILPSRMAEHALISAVEHTVASASRMKFEAAYALLSQAVVCNS